MSSWPLRLQLAKRSTTLWPTRFGWLCLIVVTLMPAVWWVFQGESLLSRTDRLSADVLVVEGWIGRNAIQAAAQEFRQGHYTYLVASGGLTSAEGWQQGGDSYADMAGNELKRAGIASEKIVVANATSPKRQRTFESAFETKVALSERSIHPKSMNVFTWGPHARRSRLVFAKVFSNETAVGVISWTPPSYSDQPWWSSSDRAKDFLTESFGYLFEAAFNSGRHG
jgi:uncharacterized SAM-binding protein YcdF (DUF218 family)